VRFEIKYIVPVYQLQLLREMIRPFIRPDKHVADRPDHQYTVRSIYYDTPDLLFYSEKIEGVPYRLKLRIRSYDQAWDKAPVFLEIKRKHMVPMTKDRAPLPYGLVRDIFGKDKGLQYAESFLKPKQLEDFSHFMYHMKKESLVPTVLVVYDREPYEALIDPSIRVTFDKSLRSAPKPDLTQLFSEDLKPVMENHFILEVKYDREYPEWMRLIVHQLGLKQQAASKYCMSIDNHPYLLRMKNWQWILSGKRPLADV